MDSQSVHDRRLPEFTRTAWSSPGARAVWEPRIHAIAQRWLAVERASVGVVRSASLQFGTSEEWLEIDRRARAIGLATGVVQTYPDGRVRFVLTKSATVGPFVTAWAEKQDDAIGEALGFPRCCRTFFHDVWNVQGLRDTTPSMALAPSEDGPPEANILLRWLGVRYVPHLPCAFDCASTSTLGAEMRALMPDPERAWADELLRWPMRWSALHGIAELETPVLKVNMDTDPTSALQEVRRRGVLWPTLGATGTRFPFVRAGQPSGDSCPGPTRWTDNGFETEQSMVRAHEIVRSVVRPLVTSASAVLDLGCGNGRLIEGLPCAGLIGIELHSLAARSSQVTILNGDLFDPAWHEAIAAADVVIVMPGRCVEQGDTDRRGQFLSALRHTGAVTVVYAYGDWMQAGPLVRLCGDAGFTGTLIDEEGSAAEGAVAGVWRWTR